MSFSAGKFFTGLFILALIGLIWLFGRPFPVYCQQSFAKQEGSVVMFSSRWCPYCRKVRQFFNANQVAYCEYDVNESETNQAIFKELGGVGVPLILIGEEVIHGFDETILSQELVRAGTIQP